MPARTTSPSVRKPGRVLGVDLDDAAWFTASRRRFAPATSPDKPITVSTGNANRLLRSIIRYVADIPAGASLDLVWQLNGNELLVDAGSVSLKATSGLVRITFTVDCDQLDKPAKVKVPIAVGAPGRPSGLVMSTFSTVDGPAVVTSTWSDAIAAFAWEALLELARRLCAAVGKDTQGRPLIPADITATTNKLVITPMARLDATARQFR